MTTAVAASLASLVKPRELPVVAICGPATCGKDLAAEYIADHTPLRFGGSMSCYLAPIMADRLGLSVEETIARKREFRKLWYDLGNELRAKDPLVLVKQCLEVSDLVVGSRELIELEAMRAANLVDLVVWIERDVPRDLTLTYGPDECDVVISNRGSIEAFYQRLDRLFSRFAGLSLDT